MFCRNIKVGGKVEQVGWPMIIKVNGIDLLN